MFFSCPTTIAHTSRRKILVVLSAISGWTLGRTEGAIGEGWFVRSLFIPSFERHFHLGLFSFGIHAVRLLSWALRSFRLFYPKLPWALVYGKFLKSAVFLSLSFRLLKWLMSLQSCGTFHITSPKFKVLEELLVFWVYLVGPLLPQTWFLSYRLRSRGGR